MLFFCFKIAVAPIKQIIAEVDAELNNDVWCVVKTVKIGILNSLPNKLTNKNAPDLQEIPGCNQLTSS